MMIRFRSLFIPVLLWLMLVPAGCAKTANPADTTPADAGQYGNIENGGYAAWDGEWIYFENGYTSGTADGKFYRIKPETEEYEVISDQPVCNIVLWEGWVYFIDESSQQIMACRPDGSEMKTVLPVRCRSFWIAGDRIYYALMGDGGSLYSSMLNGSDPQRLLGDGDYDVYTVRGGYIFYTDESKDGGNLMRMNLDGTGQRELLSEPLSLVRVMGDRVYYSKFYPLELGDTPQNGGIYVMNLDGTGSRCLLDVYEIVSLNVTDEYIYYTPHELLDDWEETLRLAQEDSIYYSMLYRGEQMMRMDLDGGNSVQVDESRCWNIHILGDYLFYHRMWPETFEPRLMKKDGSGYVTLPGVIMTGEEYSGVESR